MNEEEKVRRALDARLSGLAPSPARRARIRAAAMRPQKERKPVLPRLAAAMACLALAVGGVNIANMSLCRNRRGGDVLTIIETDQKLQADVVKRISMLYAVHDVTYYEKEDV